MLSWKLSIYHPDMHSSGKNLLLINPWIYDFTAYDLWSQPLGLLYIASFLQSHGIPANDTPHMPFITNDIKPEAVPESKQQQEDLSFLAIHALTPTIYLL